MTRSDSLHDKRPEIMGDLWRRLPTIVVLFTMTRPELKHRGVTAFLIETDRPGFERGKKEPKMGIRASATSEIIFDNYQCPVENRLGDEGEGFKIAMTGA